MFKKKTKTIKKIIPKKVVKKSPNIPILKTKSEPITLSESLINQALPIIVERFAKALKDLKSGQSIRFGKLGNFKKTKRIVKSPNGKTYTGYQYSFKAFSLVKK